MPGKFLRYLQIDFAQGNDWKSARPDIELMRTVMSRRRPSIEWMYEHFALPLPTEGIVKAIVNFTTSTTNPAIDVVPHTPEDRPGQGIAYAYQHFDVPSFLKQDESAQTEFLLEQFHAALLRCAADFGWDAARFESARQRITDAAFQIVVLAKKTATSPDRQLKARILAEVCHDAKFWIIFFDRKSQELRRIPFSIGPATTVDSRAEWFPIKWIDSHSIRIGNPGNDHYWVCHLDGSLQYHSPRAESGDPHAEYQLGKMYLDGLWVLPDQAEGWKWIQSAASKGYAHAQRLLGREQNSD